MEQDQLSYLPKHILHDILSRLPEEDAIRTSVLSKTWAQTWYTFPILSFSDMKFAGRRVHDLVKSSNITTFIDNVRRTLLRFRNQGLAIKQFNLIMISFDLYYISRYVDLWLMLAIESGVGVLKLHRSRCECQQHYILPTSILEAKSLTKLVLKGEIKVDLSLLSHSIKFFSLQVLKLEFVLLEDEHVLNHFISRCPLLEYIKLGGCECPDGEGHLHELEYVNMCGLPKLKRVYVDQIQEVYVDSPRLEKFHYCPCNEPPEKMDFSKCKNLRELCLNSVESIIITNKWFCELFANFPFLENLKLTNCSLSRRIRISSVRLKELELSHCSLKEVNIDAPNLLSCQYGDRRRALKSITFLRCSSQLKVYVWIPSYNIDFCNLREFIQNFTPRIALASISLSIHPSVDALNPLLFQVSSLPPYIPKLRINFVPENEAMYLPVVYELLSSCCPATIFIYSGLHGCEKTFIEFFYETLKGKKVDCCFCSSSNSKCWWHDLKDVKVTNSLNTDENADFKTMLAALSPDSLDHEYITFMLEF